MPTTFVLDPLALAWTVLGVVVGLVLGRLIWGRATRRSGVADSVANVAATAAARTQADAAQRELAAAQAAMRPLADEIDRLKRDLAKAKRPTQAHLPGMAAMAPLAEIEPIAPLTPMTEPIAGTGPIVIGDGGVDAPAATVPAPATLPDIRRLKGVGDKFAAALDALGLGSIDRLARLTPDEAADTDTRLGAFNGRIARDRLVEQATLIDEGRLTEYEARFGKL